MALLDDNMKSMPLAARAVSAIRETVSPEKQLLAKLAEAIRGGMPYSECKEILTEGRKANPECKPESLIACCEEDYYLLKMPPTHKENPEAIITFSMLMHDLVTTAYDMGPPANGDPTLDDFKTGARSNRSDAFLIELDRNGQRHLSIQAYRDFADRNQEVADNRETIRTFFRTLGSKANMWLAGGMICDPWQATGESQLKCSDVIRTIQGVNEVGIAFYGCYPAFFELIGSEDVTSALYDTQLHQVSAQLDQLDNAMNGVVRVYAIEIFNAACPGLNLPRQARFPDILSALRNYSASGGNLPAPTNIVSN